MPAPAAARRLPSRPRLSFQLNSPRSSFVPLSFCRIVLWRRRLGTLLPLLQFLVDHTNFEQNPARFDFFLNRFELHRRYFSWAVRHVQEHALQFVQHVGESRISFS